VEFWLILQYQAPRTNVKPPAEMQSPPIENFLVTVLCVIMKFFRSPCRIQIPSWLVWRSVDGATCK